MACPVFLETSLTVNYIFYHELRCLFYSSVVLWDQVSLAAKTTNFVTELRLSKSPGECSATVGHHFANPTNHFWRCLFESGESLHAFLFAENSID